MSRGKLKPVERGRLLPADYVFLAFLTGGEMSTYEVKKGLEASVSHFWSTAHSVVYQQAARLVRDEYVASREVPGARRKRMLSLTPAGRRAVVAWLREPDATDQFFSEMLVKVFFAAAAGDPLATKQMLENKREEYQQMLSHFESLPLPEEPVESQASLDLGIRMHRAIIEWLDDTIAKLEREITVKRRRAGTRSRS